MRLAIVLLVCCFSGTTFTQDQPLSPESIDYSSCQDRCDEGYFPGRPCYCNTACDQYENCCFDYYKICRPDFEWSDDWYEYENHTYKYFADGAVTGARAGEECRRRGALLVSLNDEAEAEFVGNSVLRKRTLSAFIGASDSTTEGTWQWSDGTLTPMPTSPWHEWYDGQPDGQAEENCAIMTNYKFWEIIKFMIDHYVWLDYSCTLNANEIQGYICEGSVFCEPNPCENGGRCSYIGQQDVTSETTCDCVGNYVGDTCQYEMKEGELWTLCGETLLAGQSGHVTSPLYPKLYPNNVRCEWTIRAEETNTIVLDVESFDVEEGKDCAFDSLMVYNGATTNASLLHAPMCGRNINATQSFTSSGNELLIVFYTDDSERRPGFKLKYKQERCGLGTGNSGCGTSRTFSSECGAIEIQTGPDSTVPCEWIIDVPPGKLINLTFLEFNIPDTGQSCPSGGLEVHDGAGTDAALLGRYCGQRFPWSVVSSGSRLYLRLSGTATSLAPHAVTAQYVTLDASEYQRLAADHVVSGTEGTFSSAQSGSNVIANGRKYQRWHVRVPAGDKLTLTWTYNLIDGSALEIYDGYSEASGSLLRVAGSDGREQSGSTTASAFQALVVFSCLVDDSVSALTVHYTAQEWLPELSGCYRPLYYSSVTSPQTENSVVTREQPVMLMVSDRSYSTTHAGYDAGVYCKWQIRSAEPTLRVSFLDVDIVPTSADCEYDGFMLYAGNDSSSLTTYGPYCGSSRPEDINLENTSSVMVVFYSDPRGMRRNAGIVRVQFSVPDPQCLIGELGGESRSGTECGVILSPRFPGLVTPTLYYWLVAGLEGSYYEIRLNYVRGPNIKDDCSQYLALVEVPHDSGKLQQIETSVLHLCGSTDVFIPHRPLRIPPNQKFAVELNVVASSLLQKWEFKMSYKAKTMERPAWMSPPDDVHCPAEYHYFRGSCYRYYPWVLRHYQDEYSFQTKWQTSLEHCQGENATLISIKDQQEAYFLKYMLAHAWHWDPAGNFQANSRFIFLGLTNKRGRYAWLDGTPMTYADWYAPKKPWEPSAILEDDVGLTFIDLSKPQPTADVGSLCTGFLANDPFGSLNWVKIPCDYPLFRSGVICEMPAAGLDEQSVNHTETLWNAYDTGVTACPEGWMMVGEKCITLLTDYSLVTNLNQSVTATTNNYYNTIATTTNDNNNDNSSLGPLPHPDAPISLSFAAAARLCSESGGDVIGRLGDGDYDRVETLLRLWRHDEQMGGIWLAGDEERNQCSFIQVIKSHYLDDHVDYSLRNNATCRSMATSHLRSVLCETLPISVEERCGTHEVACENKACVSVDHVCDGVPDCTDASDERNCSCDHAHMYSCENGRCIPVNLMCNFRDDCGDNSDEDNCVLEECGEGDEFRCASGQCVSAASKCDFITDCVDGSDETDKICESECSGLTCFSGICLPGSLQEDLISDCPGFSLEDELDTNKELVTFFDIFKNEDPAADDTTNQTGGHLGCGGHDEVTCRLGQPRCYRRSQSCVYDTLIVDEAKELEVQAACRDGSHVRDYCDAVSCPGMYACRGGAYCVPYRKLCDVTKDCPHGDDELGCDHYHCPGLYKCKGEQFCIPHSEVCDGTVHCLKHRDDEMYCQSEVAEPLCSVTQCSCSGHTVFCDSASLATLPQAPTPSSIRPARALFLAHNQLRITADTFLKFHWLIRLVLSHNGLTSLPARAFLGLQNLHELNLSHNAISQFRPGTFAGLVSLRILDISHNALSHLDRSALAELSRMELLIMEHNPLLKDIAEDTFDGLDALRMLNTDAFKFCCVASSVETCTPAADEFSSCKDLMANYPLQISIWVLGLSAFCGNIFVVIWRIMKDRSKVSSFFIINLGVSDLLMGVYLLIIGAVDAHYRGKYILYADAWRASALCQLAGIVAMISSEVSVFMLTAITVDRVVSIMFPLKMRAFRLKHARIVAGSGWVACVLLSVLPATGASYFGDAFFGRTGVCLPFQVSNEKLPGWEYSVFIFLVVNLISFIVIFGGYVVIFWTVKSSMATMNSQSGGADEYALAKKLALIVATDFVCWVPIILIGFAALGGSRIDPQVSAWIAVFILPLNSAINPILYTMSAIQCGKKRKSGGRMQRTGTSYVSQTETTAACVELNEKRAIPDVTKTTSLSVNPSSANGNGSHNHNGMENEGFDHV